MLNKVYSFLVTLFLLAQLSSAVNSTDSAPLPRLEDTLAEALLQAERTLTECILSNAEFSIKYHGTSSIPLDDIDLEFGNIALVRLSNLWFSSSPFHMVGVTPHLRLMSIDLRANISLVQVTGNYNVSPEIMNFTSRELIATDEGTLNLTFHDVEILGTVGLNLNESRLYINTVDLTYRPLTAVLSIKFKDGKGQDQIMEERRQDIRNSIEEPIYKDLAGRLNTVLKEQLNELLANVSVPDLLENSSDAEISFRTAADNHIGNINDFVDTILNALRENITEEVHLPELEKSIERRVGFLKLRGTFKAEQGWLKSLNTLHRTGDVILRTIDNGIEVSAALGLTTMHFGYKRYSVRFMHVGTTGSITAKVGQNSVSLRGRVRYVDNNCTVTLEELKVRVLNNIKMELTGLSPFNWALSKVATSIVNRSKHNIIKNIEKTVGDKIRSQLQTFDCSSFFPQPA